MDVSVLEVHFARDNAVFERFSVTTPGWHSIWLLTKYSGAYARDSECMVRSEAIVWSRYIDTTQWYEIDPVNLIPQAPARKETVIKVINHLNHAPTHRDDDECGVSGELIDGFGWVYHISEEDDDGSLLS